MFLNFSNRFAFAILVAMLVAGGSGYAQPTPLARKPSAAVPPASSLPANQSTGSEDEAEAAVTNQRAPAQRFQVDYTVGQVAVDATNASLNQVVREVARKASIKVTGNVTDERIFGHYGPSAPSIVLAALLDGTGSNMLLVSDARGASELILTPRRGSVTPPNPNAAAQQASDPDDTPEPQQYVPPSRTFQPPVATGRGPVNANADGSPDTNPPQPEAGANPAEDDTDTGSQPNAQKTPQQIYEQLQKMMQQRQSTAPAPAQEPQEQ